METEGGGLFFKSGIDNKQFDAAIAESTKRIQGMSTATVAAGEKIDKVFTKLTSESTNSSQIISKNYTRQIGLIADIEKELVKLREAKRNAFTIEDIEKYNKKIQEAELNLKEYNQAGRQTIDNTKELTKENFSLNDSVGKWVLGLGGAAAILGALKKAFLETTGGMNLFNNIGAITKQVLYDITSGAGLSISSLQKALGIQQQLNALRVAGYAEDFKAAQLNTRYQQLYSQSLDATLSNTEKIKVIDQALEAHSKAIEIEIEHTEKLLKLATESLENSPGSEKYKKEYAELQIKLQNLDAERYESTKRLTRQKSILEKEEIDKQMKWREALHKDLQKAADEQIEINNSIPEQIKLLNEAVEAGNTKEIKAIADRIKVLQDELNVRTEIAKAALLSAFTDGRGAVTKVDTGNIKVNVPFVAPTLPGLQSASTEATKGTVNAGARQWNIDDWEAGEKKKKQQEDILQGARQLTYELGQQLGLDESQLQAIDSMMSLLSGDYIGAAVGFLSDIIKQIPSQAAKFQAQIDAINVALEKQQKLIDESQRKGGEKDARQKELDILNQQKAALEAQAAKDKKKINSWIDLFGSQDRARKDLDKVNAALDETNEKIKVAQEAMNDFLSGGVTENDLADVIAQGLQEGKTSVDDFADYMNSVLMDAVMSIFKAEILGPAITELSKYITDALSDKVLTPEEKAEIDKRTAKLAADNKELWDNLTQGLDPTGAAGADKSLTGAVKGVTEETASVLAGQINAIRITQADSNSMMRQQMMHLSEIASNTRYLKSIDNKLSGGKSDSLRSQGLV